MSLSLKVTNKKKINIIFGTLSIYGIKASYLLSKSNEAVSSQCLSLFNIKIWVCILTKKDPSHKDQKLVETILCYE